MARRSGRARRDPAGDHLDQRGTKALGHCGIDELLWLDDVKQPTLDHWLGHPLRFVEAILHVSGQKDPYGVKNQKKGLDPVVLVPASIGLGIHVADEVLLTTHRKTLVENVNCRISHVGCPWRSARVAFVEALDGQWAGALFHDHERT